MEFVFVTRNAGKMWEIREILKGSGISALSMDEAGINADIVEDGVTFEDNAVKKAMQITGLCKNPVIADDSGLEIDFLDKGPGVYSARFLGEQTPYEEKIRHILDVMKAVPAAKRGARFVCVIAAAFPDGRIITKRGAVSGIIAQKPAGRNGFGYDPIFFVPEYGMTTAEMDPGLKNSISHRGIALRGLIPFLKG
ncbi:MAG: RdgB/HAM1 family non-canonical purine NTP pyrophosphatase [Clostridiales bacterium]|jgi:XTP/dITP diphosphohydrolase|nr:RdgB/HAM1 family non-canonical purine NTP pyrophosphatase [Clostridiales bacterium]